MLFISGEPSPQYVLVHGSAQVVQSLQGNVRRVTKPAVAKFAPVTGRPFRTSTMPTKGGLAKGKLYSDEAAQQIRNAGHTQQDEKGNDITERWLIERLMNHPSYGREFVAVGVEDGEELVGKQTYRIPEGDGGVFCSLCNKHFRSAQAYASHEATSKEHAANLAQAEAKITQNL